MTDLPDGTHHLRRMVLCEGHATAKLGRASRRRQPQRPVREVTNLRCLSPVGPTAFAGEAALKLLEDRIRWTLASVLSKPVR
jgi:hypothetical protein